MSDFTKEELELIQNALSWDECFEVNQKLLAINNKIQSLIESQIKYCEVSGAKLVKIVDKKDLCNHTGFRHFDCSVCYPEKFTSNKCPHDITPRNCPDCVLPECQHEKDDHYYNLAGEVHYKCIKCGGFYR